MNHTPGPWTFRTILPSGRQGIEAGREGTLVAFWDEGRGLGHSAEANMALVAAAPDLLAALRRLVEWNDQDRDEGFLEDALHAARGAIAKAEG